MADNEEEARKAQFELQLGVQQAGHAEDVHRIEQNMRANIRRLRKLNAEGKREEIKEFIEKITHIMKQKSRFPALVLLTKSCGRKSMP